MDLTINSKYRVEYFLHDYALGDKLVNSIEVIWGKIDNVEEDEYYKGEFTYDDHDVYDDFSVFTSLAYEMMKDELWDYHQGKESVEIEFFETEEECLKRFEELKNNKDDVRKKHL